MPSEEIDGLTHEDCIDTYDDSAGVDNRPTCTIVCECNAYDSWGDRIAGLHYYELSCGHVPAGFEKPQFCSCCGAKVVKRA